MKKITCEMCGSSDFIKDGGVFVCQECGCKYSIEEAKKLMAEDSPTNIPQATEPVPQENRKLDNLRKLAKRAKEENDSATAEKYFGQILLEDPDDWEANFYTIYYAAHNIKIAQIGEAANRVSNCIEPVLKLIKKNINNKEQQKAAYNEVGSKIIDFTMMLVTNATDHMTSFSYSKEQIEKYEDNWYNSAVMMVAIFGNKVSEIFKDYDLGKSSLEFAIKALRDTDQGRKLKVALQERLIEITRLKRESKKEAYWEAHSEERAKLEAEKKELLKKVEPIKQELKNVSEEKLNSINSKLSDLKTQKNSLGLFAFKAKKEFDEKIKKVNDEKDSELSRLTKIRDEIQSRIDPLLKRISDIDAEFAKDRD